MRTQLAITLSTALLAGALPTHVWAQHGAGGRLTIPRAPVVREQDHGAPLFEPGHPHGPVPYVRDGHWYGHAAPDDVRFRLARPFEFGRFALPGPSHLYRVTRVDLDARRIWLPGGHFEIAAWEWANTAPWCWTCDDFVVYVDPDHVGWYLIYDARMGEYVHAQFLGV